MPIKLSTKREVAEPKELRSGRIELLVSMAIAIIGTLARGIRLPNDWAEAHWLIGYGTAGFIKRGLPGALLELFAPSDPLVAIQCVSVVLLVAFAVVFFIKSYKLAIGSATDTAISALFLCSPFIVQSAHVIGYYDSIILLLGALAAHSIRQNRNTTASILLAVGVLVHESILIIAMPAVIYISFSRHLLSPTNGNLAEGAKSFLRANILTMVLPLFAFLLLVLFSVGGSGTYVRLADHLSQFGFVEQNRNTMVAEAFTTSFSSYFRDQFPEGFRRLFHPGYWLLVGYPLVMMLALAWSRVRQLRHSRAIVLGLVAVCLMPLLLHFIAWDTSRIWSYSLVAFFMAYSGLLGATTEIENTNNKLGPKMIILVLLAIVTEFAATVPLMDGETDNLPIWLRMVCYAPILVILLQRAKKPAT